MDTTPYDTNQSAINTAWTNATNQINTQRQQYTQQLGGSFDAGGNFQINNANPYGEVQNLRNTQGLDLAGERGSEATRGIGAAGYGLAGQREQLMRAGDRQQQFTLLGQALSNFTNFSGQQSAADASRDQATGANKIAQANEAALEQAWAPAVPGNPTPGAPGSTPATANWNDNPSGYNWAAPQNTGAPGGVVKPKPVKQKTGYLGHA